MKRAVASVLLFLGTNTALASELAVWIDADPACDGAVRHDPDDCFAILHLLGVPGIAVRGISTTFGNTDLEAVDEVIERLLAVEPRDRPVPVFSGASGPGDCDTEAVTALGEALREATRLEILAIGPVTNVACVLRANPTAAERVARIVAVMGARPGHVFHPAEERRSEALFGHGPVFSDLNLEKDPEAARSLIETEIPLVLVPYEAARWREVGREELRAMAARGSAMSFVSSRSNAWLQFWIATTGRDGFYPFDLVAAALVSGAIPFRCDRERVAVAHDRSIGFFGGPLRLLLLGDETGRPGGQAQVCHPIGAPRRISVDQLFPCSRCRAGRSG